MRKSGDVAAYFNLGLELVAANPDDMDLHIAVARDLVAVDRCAEAIRLLDHVVEVDASARSWPTHWACVHLAEAHFRLGAMEKARECGRAALAMETTPNATKAAQTASRIMGFDRAYDQWVHEETEHLRLHFSPHVPEARRIHFARTREAAYGTINRFFGAELPKKIDVFVWSGDPTEEVIVGKLGFARPELCVVHTRVNQTPGHEIAHVLSRRGVVPVRIHGFISEGIAVHFDLSGGDALAAARDAVRKAGDRAPSIATLWSDEFRRFPDTVSYPIAGAFVAMLREKGGDEKLKALAAEQTLEAARRIYGAAFDAWVAGFEDSMRGSAPGK